VAGAGDVNGDGYADVIVGAHSYDAPEEDEGAAFVFRGSASGIANADCDDSSPPSCNPEAAAAQLESDQARAELGLGVAGAGDVNGDGYADVIVGARYYNADEPHEGAAFVFRGSASGIANADCDDSSPPRCNPAAAAAQLESDQASTWLGGSVAGAGDVNGDGYADVIVGASGYDADESDEGAAFVFFGSASGIANEDCDDSSPPRCNPGAAAAQFESDQEGAQLGNSAAGAGDVNGDGYADVIVGAWRYDTGKEPSNAACTADRDPYPCCTGVGQGTCDDDGAAFAFLGSASGIEGCIGSSPARCNPGAAAAQLESDQANPQLGNSVAGAGDVNGDGYADVIVGAFTYNKLGATNEGAAFVYRGGASGIASGNPSTAGAKLESDQLGAELGFSVAGAGDVDGDGYADVIVGAAEYDAGETDEGAAFVYLGGASGIADGDSTPAAAQLESDQAGAGLGQSVARAGDVDGDGYADVIVGSYLYDTGKANAACTAVDVPYPCCTGVGTGTCDDEGAAFVFRGSDSGIEDCDDSSPPRCKPGAAAQLESDQSNAELGWSVAGAGDVNGDGYADVIVGAPRYDADESDEGAAFVFVGTASGIVDGDPSTAAARLESDQADAQLGTSVAGAGDVNGDGYADVIVGAHHYEAGEEDEGAAFVFLGSDSGIEGCNGSSPPSCNPEAAAAQLESDQASTWLGGSVAGAGDVNGDGYADVIVGASDYDAGQGYGEGAAFVFLGSASGVKDFRGFPTPRCGPGKAAAQLESDQLGAQLGNSVAGAGDVNGDGYADVIVGASEYDAGQGYGEGAAFVFLGSAWGIVDGNPTTAAARLESDQADAQLGWSVAGAGDVNGDGYADVIVGAPRYDADESDEGAAFVFLGGGDGDGRPVLARQLRSGVDTTPVQPWGRACDGDDFPDYFQVQLAATHPEGRGRVKVEVETCPSGVAFGDASCIQHIAASWTDVTATPGGVTLSEEVLDLSAPELQRWRARVLYAPYSVTQSGITASPSRPRPLAQALGPGLRGRPSRGPHRRLRRRLPPRRRGGRPGHRPPRSRHGRRRPG
jgi:hypothetical protein